METSQLGLISAQDELLSLSYGNVRGMSIGQDAQILLSVTDTVWAFKLNTQTVTAVGSILPHMRDPEDAKRVRAELQHSLAGAIEVATIEVDAMNGYMTELKGAAALAETTRARDEMIAIREALRSLRT
jgi:hypothetical protein